MNMHETSRTQNDGLVSCNCREFALRELDLVNKTKPPLLFCKIGPHIWTYIILILRKTGKSLEYRFCIGSV
jgi:hypothetical protein